MASYLRWYYIIGSGVVLHALYGIYKSLIWIWQAKSKGIRRQVLVANNSSGPHDVAVDIDLIIPPSPSHRPHVKRVPSFNKAFSYPAHTTKNGFFQQKENR